jgi:hypothetical protein
LNSRGEVVARQGFDIVANDVAVFSRSAHPFLAQLTQGVVDTNAESLLMRVIATNVAEILATTEGGDAWVTIRGEGDMLALANSVPTEALAQVTETLREGYVVVAPPPAKATSETDWAYWKIDPRTGSTLGIGREGWGDGSAEKSLLEVLMATSRMAGILTFNLMGITLVACMARKTLMGDIDWSNTGSSQGWSASQSGKNKKSFRDCACGAWDVGATVGPVLFTKLTPKDIALRIALGIALAKMGKQAFCA